MTLGLGSSGEFLFAENDGLTKLIQTVVEDLPRRTSGTAVEHHLYGEPVDRAPMPPILHAVLRVTSRLGSCK